MTSVLPEPSGAEQVEPNPETWVKHASVTRVLPTTSVLPAVSHGLLERLPTPKNAAESKSSLVLATDNNCSPIDPSPQPKLMFYMLSNHFNPMEPAPR